MCLLNDNGTFFCNCSLGWSGPLCENPPDMCAGNICMNGGVCKNLNISYTCSCRLGYSGSLCQVSPVDGNWSDWSRWSKCSVTCGVGVRSRNRSCDNPPKDKYGKLCQGSYTESSDCENDKCEECPALKHTNESLSFYECKTDADTGLKTCEISCKNGTIPVLRLEGFQTLRCGHETNYYWLPGNVQVPCVVPKVPEVFELETEITYNSSIPKEQQPEVEDQVRKNINETSCIQSSHCNTTMNFIPNQVGDYTETKLILTFHRNLDYIQLDVNPLVLNELQKVFSDLKSTAEYLRNYTEKVFNVNTSGRLIQADEPSLHLQGFFNCTKGHIYVNGVCVGCPDSTSKKSHRCEFCPKGIFQMLRGQTACINCPLALGQTTRTPESFDEGQCFEYISEVTDETGSNSESSLSETYIAVIISSLVTVFVGVPGFVGCVWKIKKIKRKKRKEEEADNGIPMPDVSEENGERRGAENLENNGRTEDENWFQRLLTTISSPAGWIHKLI
ncbi:uncharacterized protein LOC128552113 isoform X2 [Mercenaria mercenaria]|uniref:uncharacterized protein LOC128552113 isoform X2 n=1 Tax=Mercenaria mercenaria TaxID=6596 RepID=UPI00234F49E8|nr:uncharacterized protein LOC128552113 isoform X2 [Mercenaria mercenaria]